MYDFKNKTGNIQQLNNYMLAKTLSMFEYENLPETIPYRELEYLLQTNGYAFITKVKGELYAFNGSIGGEVDVYNRPTKITINNVALKYNETLDIKKDGVLIRNDDMCMGLIPLYEKHHFMMIENDINMVVHGYNNRVQKLISASDDKTKQSAEIYLKKSIEGEIGIIGETAIFEGIKLHSGNGNQSNSISNMIEFNQYIKGTLYNEVGLSSNFSMKKERLITAEVNQSEDSLFPFVYNMMKCRLKAIELINEMFETKIDIDFGSVWHFKNKELIDDTIDTNKLPEETIETITGDGEGNEPKPTITDPEPEPDSNESNAGDEIEVPSTDKVEVIEEIIEQLKDEINDTE